MQSKENDSTDGNGKNRPICQRSVESRILEDFITAKVEADPNAVISYREMSDAIGRNVQETGRGILYGVLRVLKRERKMVFVTIWKTGIRLAYQTDFTGIAERQLKVGARADKRRLHESLSIPKEQYEALTPEERQRHNLCNTLLGMRVALTKRPTQKRIEEVVKSQGGLVAAQPVIEHLASAK